MNDQMLGADPEQLRELAKLFSKYSTVLNSTSAELHPAIMRLRWNGPDAERFRHVWSTRMQPHIKSASTLLRDASKKLQVEATQQEHASSETSLVGPGGSSTETGQTGTSPTDTQRQLENMDERTGLEVQEWWNNLTDEQQQELLKGKDENGIPNAYYLAALHDKLPIEAQRQAREWLVENAKSSIPMYTQIDKIGVDGQLGWVHGGAHVGTQITQNADGSATLKLSGDLTGGVNTPSTKAGVDASLTGEISKTYVFNSLEEALAAREQMLDDLPPDDFGRASDAIKNPAGYLEGTLDTAAKHNGATDEYTSAKGTVSVGASGKLGEGQSASANLALAYERNLTNGTSTASGTLTAGAELELGDGMKFGGNGEVGVTVSMDRDGDVQKLTLDLQGTVESTSTVHTGPNSPDPLAGILDPTLPADGPSSESKAGPQGTLQLEVQNTRENQHLIESYLGNVASGNDAAAQENLQRIYHASAVTGQTNSVISNDTKIVDFDSGIAKLEVGGSTEVTSNAGTLHKAPYDDSFEVIEGESRYEVNQ